MAKKGSEGGEAPKRKKRIPKEIAGFKIPKDVRKAGEKLLDKAATPEGRKAIASGIGMIATAAIAAAEAKRRRS